MCLATFENKSKTLFMLHYSFLLICKGKNRSSDSSFFLCFHLSIFSILNYYFVSAPVFSKEGALLQQGHRKGRPGDDAISASECSGCRSASYGCGACCGACDGCYGAYDGNGCMCARSVSICIKEDRCLGAGALEGLAGGYRLAVVGRLDRLATL